MEEGIGEEGLAIHSHADDCHQSKAQQEHGNSVAKPYSRETR